MNTADGSFDGEGVRQRKTQTTFAEDASSPPPTLGRRKSSNSFQRAYSHRTDSSVGASSRRSIQTTAVDSVFVPRATDEVENHEPNLWHSAPLLFAIIPAIGGVVFKRGSVLLTDLALLVLAALYLNWCLVTPWIWYHSAQSVKVADFPHQDATLGPLDDALGDGIGVDASQEDMGKKAEPTSPDTSGTSAALQELRMHEVTALALCFLGPLLGSYILHIIRLQLSSLGDQLVSNLHLTLFVLGAEIRPLRYAMKMAQARTIYLQRVVREDPHAQSQEDKTTLQDLNKRLDELEASYVEKVANNDIGINKHHPDIEESMKKAQNSLQTQIDALNRAVRRYEKRATAQTIQTEARLQDLDTRLKDAVSLAAAAANYSQQPSVMMLALSSLKSMLLLPVGAAWAAIKYPFQLLRVLVLRVALRLGVVMPARRPAPQSRSKGDASTVRKSKNSSGKE